MTATVVSLSDPIHASAGPAVPVLSAVPLGDSPALELVLSAALDSVPAADGAADGVLVALEGWTGDGPPPEVARVVDRLGRSCLRGRPVGMIALSADLTKAARALAWLRGAVRGHGGLPVGVGISVDAAEFVAVGSGWEFADITLPASLALLGRRVRALAWSRRILSSV